MELSSRLLSLPFIVVIFFGTMFMKGSKKKNA